MQAGRSIKMKLRDRAALFALQLGGGRRKGGRGEEAGVCIHSKAIIGSNSEQSFRSVLLILSPFFFLFSY